MRIHFIPISMAEIKETMSIRCYDGVAQTEPPASSSRDVNYIKPSGE